MEIWRGYQWALSLTSSEGVKAAALGLERQAKGRSTCLYSHRTAWALLSLGQGHDHPGPGLHWVWQRVDFILWYIHIFPRATPGPLRPAWPSSSSVSSLCSTEKGATGTSRCSVGGDISLEGCASSPAFSHQQDSSVKLANAGQKKKLRCPNPSTQQTLTEEANFVLCQLPYLFLFQRKRFKECLVQLMFLFKME